MCVYVDVLNQLGLLGNKKMGYLLLLHGRANNVSCQDAKQAAPYHNCTLVSLKSRKETDPFPVS